MYIKKKKNTLKADHFLQRFMSATLIAIKYEIKNKNRIIIPQRRVIAAYFSFA